MRRKSTIKKRTGPLPEELQMLKRFALSTQRSGTNSASQSWISKEYLNKKKDFGTSPPETSKESNEKLDAENPKGPAAAALVKKIGGDERAPKVNNVTSPMSKI